MSHSELTLEDVIEAWTSDMDRMQHKAAGGVWRGMSFSSHAVRLLALGRPVSTRQLAEVSGLPLSDVQDTFAKIQEQGGELDKDGNLVGLALTLNPTPHRFVLNGRSLYTWCALDAVFLPGLLGETASIESICPTTGELIQLTIQPDGVADYAPQTAVISVAVPGISCRREDDEATKPKTGPKSDGCSQMHFFASQEPAQAWVEQRPGLVVLTIEEAYRLAYENWIGRQMTLSPGHSDNLDSRSENCCC